MYLYLKFHIAVGPFYLLELDLNVIFPFLGVSTACICCIDSDNKEAYF